MQIESTVETLVRGRTVAIFPSYALLSEQSRRQQMNAASRLSTPTLKTLGDKHHTHNVLVVPVAFVSDHVETLSEINIEAREEAAHHGIRRFELTPGLNDDPGFIRALAGLVLGRIGAA